MTRHEINFMKHEKLAEKAVMQMKDEGWKEIFSTHRHGDDFPVREIVMEKAGARTRLVWNTQWNEFVES